jgi:hypothetical protein
MLHNLLDMKLSYKGGEVSRYPSIAVFRVSHGTGEGSFGLPARVPSDGYGDGNVDFKYVGDSQGCGYALGYFGGSVAGDGKSIGTPYYCNSTIVVRRIV